MCHCLTCLKAQERLETQHQITAIIVNKVSLLFKNEIISVNVSKTKRQKLNTFFANESMLRLRGVL